MGSGIQTRVQGSVIVPEGALFCPCCQGDHQPPTPPAKGQPGPGQRVQLGTTKGWEGTRKRGWPGTLQLPHKHCLGTHHVPPQLHLRVTAGQAKLPEGSLLLPNPARLTGEPGFSKSLRTLAWCLSPHLQELMRLLPRGASRPSPQAVPGLTPLLMGLRHGHGTTETLAGAFLRGALFIYPAFPLTWPWRTF